MILRFGFVGLLILIGIIGLAVPFIPGLLLIAIGGVLLARFLRRKVSVPPPSRRPS